MDVISNKNRFSALVTTKSVWNPPCIPPQTSTNFQNVLLCTVLLLYRNATNERERDRHWWVNVWFVASCKIELTSTFFLRLAFSQLWQEMNPLGNFVECSRIFINICTIIKTDFISNLVSVSVAFNRSCGWPLSAWLWIRVRGWRKSTHDAYDVPWTSKKSFQVE